MNFEVIIVGAGPIGLLLSIKLKEEKKTVLVIEKRQEFTRQQIIIIDEQFYNALPSRVIKELFGEGKYGCYVLPPPQDWQGICYTEKNFESLPFASIRIDLLQQALLEEAKRLGVVYVVGDITKIEPPYVTVSDEEEHYKFEILIGADGKQSLVRERVLKSELLRGVIKRPLKVPKWWASEALYTYQDAEFGVETPKGFEYYISDTQKLRTPLRRFKDYVVLLNLEIPKRNIADSPKKEYRWQGRQDRFRFLFSQRGDSRFSLRLTESELKLFQKREDKTKIPDWLVLRVKNLLHLVYHIPLENIQINHEKSQLIEIELTKASKFAAKAAGNSLVVLVGDSANTTHFFTGNGANYGWRAAQKLLDLLAMPKIKRSVLIKEYTQYVDRILAEQSARMSMSFWYSPEHLMRICSKLTDKQLLNIARRMYQTPIPKDLAKSEMCELLENYLIPYEKQLIEKKYLKCKNFLDEDEDFEMVTKAFPFLAPLNQLLCYKRAVRFQYIPISEYKAMLSNKDFKDFEDTYARFSGKLNWYNNQSQYWFEFIDMFKAVVDSVIEEMKENIKQDRIRRDLKERKFFDHIFKVDDLLTFIFERLHTP